MTKSVLAGKTYIDLFAGIGGFHLGMESLGMDCVFASEWDKHAAAVYERNFGLAPKGDITKIDAGDVPKHFMICGGFPCQAFSISGKRMGFADTRGTLFFDVARIAKEHKPSVLFLENVRNFAQHDGGKTLKTVQSVLEDLGYVVFHKVINAAAHGFATARQRIYIVAFREDVGVEPGTGFSFPSPAGPAPALRGFLEPTVSLADVKVEKPAAMAAGKGSAAAIAAFRAKRPASPIRIGTIAGGGQGDRIYSIDGPAITLSAYGGGNAAKTGAYLVDGVVRKLTPRECANIMGFPATFKIPAKNNQAYKQFGNSVVVGVIKAIGAQIDVALINAAQKKKPSKPAAKA